MFSDLETHEMFPKQTEKQSKVLNSFLTNQALSWVCRCVSWRETREDEPSGQYHHINKSFRKLVQVWTFHTSRETKSQNSWEVHIGPLVTCSTTQYNQTIPHPLHILTNLSCWTPAPSVLRTVLIFLKNRLQKVTSATVTPSSSTNHRRRRDFFFHFGTNH